MKLMDAKFREQVDKSIEKAAELANSGMHPNDAITKVAEENGYNPDIGRLMARNFNITKTLAHFDTFKTDHEKRASDFDVADAEVVASRLQKSLETKATKKASVPKTVGIQDHLNNNSVDVEWFRNKYCKNSQKVASEEIDIFEFEEYLKHKTKVKEKIAFYKSESGKANVRAQDIMAKIADLSRNTKDFKTIESDVAHEMGTKVASLIFDSIERLVPFKEFGLSRSTSPSNIVKYPEAVKLAKELVHELEKAAHYAEAHTKIKEAAVVLDDDVLPGLSIGKTISSGIADASASLKNTVSGIAGSVIPEKKVDSNPDLRLDRDLEGELDGAKSSLILSDMLANDDVLSEEDPALVAEMARKQLELNPNLLKYPAVLAGAIRRAIATRGDIDSHEGKQLIHLDKSPG